MEGMVVIDKSQYSGPSRDTMWSDMLRTYAPLTGMQRVVACVDVAVLETGELAQ
jgi:hypothetical protein